MTDDETRLLWTDPDIEDGKAIGRELARLKLIEAAARRLSLAIKEGRSGKVQLRLLDEALVWRW